MYLCMPSVALLLIIIIINYKSIYVQMNNRNNIFYRLIIFILIFLGRIPEIFGLYLIIYFILQYMKCKKNSVYQIIFTSELQRSEHAYNFKWKIFFWSDLWNFHLDFNESEQTQSTPVSLKIKNSMKM